MRHIMGNGTKCIECKWYSEKEDGDKCRGDGWCHNPRHLSIGINGKKRTNPPKKEPRMWQLKCRLWEDAEYPHINDYEAATHLPDPSRSPIEQLIIADAIKKAEEEQKDLDAYYQKRRMEQRWRVEHDR